MKPKMLRPSGQSQTGLPAIPGARQVQLLPEEEAFERQKGVSLTPEHEANPQASQSLSDQSEMTIPMEDRCYAAIVTCSTYCQKVPEVCQHPHVWDETSTAFTDAKGEQIYSKPMSLGKYITFWVWRRPCIGYTWKIKNTNSRRT